jgi:hypothetical protein
MQHKILYTQYEGMFMNQGAEVLPAIGWMTWESGFVLWLGIEVFHLHCIQTGSGVNLASCQWVQGVF